MAHGQPDFGMYTQKKTTYGLADMGELVARLGSIVTHDRRGDVIFLDDFESDIVKWGATLGGVGAAAVMSPEAARSRAFSAKLVTGDADGDATYIETWNPYPVLGKFGLEVSISIGGLIENVQITFQVYDGTNYHLGDVYFAPQTNRLTILDGATGLPVLIDTVDLYETFVLFHTFKVVCDFQANQYVRLILNDIEYDISGYALFTFGSGIAAHLRAVVLAENFAAGNHHIYVEDVIITQNEP